MKKLILLFCIIIAFFSCGDEENDFKKYKIKIRNESDFFLYDISIEMETLNPPLPDSAFVDSLDIFNETEEFIFGFDRTSQKGCSQAVGITLAASFNGCYMQNDSLKYFWVVMEDKETDFVTVIINNVNYSIFDN